MNVWVSLNFVVEIEEPYKQCADHQEMITVMVLFCVSDTMTFPSAAASVGVGSFLFVCLFCFVFLQNYLFHTVETKNTDAVNVLLFFCQPFFQCVVL